MTIFQWYRRVLSDYALFRGRARRQEFWYFFVANVFIELSFRVGASAVQGALGYDWQTSFTDFINLALLVFSLAILLPVLAVSVRRLHDSGHSGWWLSLILLPPVGWLVLAIFYLLDSSPGDNRYGANPKPSEFDAFGSAIVAE